jgi:endonuclease
MRRCQHAVCQCRRDAAPACVGHTTTCAVPGYSSWSQPGQRYALVAAAPGTGRTTQSPSGQSSIRSGPSGAAGAAERGFQVLRGLTAIKPIRVERRASLLSTRARHWLVRNRVRVVRLVIARCSVDYDGRLTAHLPSALRLLIVKADGSVLVHSDGGSYKPLNWMSPPCRLTEHPAGDGQPGKWTVTNKAGETLTITIEETLSDTSVDLGIDPGLVKDGVEAHLQELLAEQLHLLGDGWRLIRREYPTPTGPVDIMCRDDSGAHVAVEMKRHAGIDAVEQLTRYLELLNRDPLLSPVQGVLAAQTIKLQARTLAEDRGIRCVVLDYDAMRGIEREGTLF